MLLRIETSALLAVDFQERLMPAIHQADQTVAHAAWLIRIAQRLGAKVLASEQYPQGLGPTVAAIRELLPAEAFMTSTSTAPIPVKRYFHLQTNCTKNMRTSTLRFQCCRKQ